MPELALRVSQLCEYLSTRLSSDAVLREVAVTGEIADVYIRQNVRIFTLRDERAAIRCVVDADAAVDCELADDAAVTVCGNVGFYPRDGRISLFAARIASAGEGEKNAKLAELMKRLGAEGLFDAGRKRALPAVPLRLGVVTSSEGAVIHDIITVAKRRFPGVNITVYPSRVQGEYAAGDLISGIAYFNQREDVDVIIVARGGGSSDDLSVFDDESVVRAVACSKLPTVSAVGHETDTSLTDLAADLRAPTPSAAAELVLPEKQALIAELARCRGELTTALVQRLAREQNRLSGCRGGMDAALRRTVDACRTELSVERARLFALSPHATLARGYAIVRRDGRAVTNACELATGDEVELTMKGGMAGAVIRSGNDGEKL